MPIVAIRTLSAELILALYGIVLFSEFSEASELRLPDASKREDPPSCLMNFLRDDLLSIPILFLSNLKTYEYLV
jgi:hypothetical protein